MFEERGLGGKNINPMMLRLSNGLNNWTKKKARYFNIRPAELGRMMFILHQEDPNFEKKMQERFGVVPDQELYTIPENKGYKIYGD
jgi:hypothetical protein